MHHDPENIDLEQRTLQTIDNPSGTRLSPKSRVRSVTYVSGMDQDLMAGAASNTQPK
jgi:hypothetical protein